MRLSDVETPQVIVRYRQLLRNIERMARIARSARINLRPHVKTHKCPAIAHLQLKSGAIGVTVAKVQEAEVMAAAGIDDILVAYPIFGEEKARAILRLARWVKRIACTVDDVESAGILSRVAASEGRRIEVLIEVDTGLGRCGRVAGNDVVDFALAIKDLPGIYIRGILTHAGHAYNARSKEELSEIAVSEGRLMADTADLLRKARIYIEDVSVGSTPTAAIAAQEEGVTEIRPGTYVFNDASQVAVGVAGLDDCALTVLSTVVSRPSVDRAIIDAGSKVLSSDVGLHPGLVGFGIIKGRPDLEVARLSEEHGIVRPKAQDSAEILSCGSLAEPARQGRLLHLKVGDKIEIIPNHVCPVVNLTDTFYVVDDDDEVIAGWPVTARGKTK